MAMRKYWSNSNMAWVILTHWDETSLQYCWLQCIRTPCQDGGKKWEGCMTCFSGTVNYLYMAANYCHNLSPCISSHIPPPQIPFFYVTFVIYWKVLTPELLRVNMQSVDLKWGRMATSKAILSLKMYFRQLGELPIAVENWTILCQAHKRAIRPH